MPTKTTTKTKTGTIDTANLARLAPHYEQRIFDALAGAKVARTLSQKRQEEFRKATSTLNELEAALDAGDESIQAEDLQLATATVERAERLARAADREATAAAVKGQRADITLALTAGDTLATLLGVPVFVAPDFDGAEQPTEPTVWVTQRHPHEVTRGWHQDQVRGRLQFQLVGGGATTALPNEDVIVNAFHAVRAEIDPAGGVKLGEDRRSGSLNLAAIHPRLLPGPLEPDGVALALAGRLGDRLDTWQYYYTKRPAGTCYVTPGNHGELLSETTLDDGTVEAKVRLVINVTGADTDDLAQTFASVCDGLTEASPLGVAGGRTRFTAEPLPSQHKITGHMDDFQHQLVAQATCRYLPESTN